jgi:hypothetical protein
LRRTAALAVLVALSLPAPAWAASAPHSFFGVDAPGDTTDAELETMQEGGVTAVRWLTSWPALQHSAASPPDWSGVDRLVAGLAENHIEPIPMVYGSPCFVVDCAGHPPGEGVRQPPIGTPEARLAWAHFLGSLVDRYGPHGSLWSDHPALPRQPIRTWQIWNEQNAEQFYRPAPSVSGYLELLRISAQSIRSRDPGATILLGGMFGDPHAPGVPAPEYLDDLYQAGGADYFDGVAAHPYSPDLAGVRSQIAQLRRVMDAHGDSATPIWVTELGWGATPDGKGKFADTIEGQATRLTEAFTLLAAQRRQWNIAKVLWYTWQDTPPDHAACSWCATAGLVDVDLQPKPVWAAYTALAGGTSPTTVSSDEGSLPVLALIAVALVLVGAAAWLVRRGRRTR